VSVLLVKSKHGDSGGQQESFMSWQWHSAAYSADTAGSSWLKRSKEQPATWVVKPSEVRDTGEFHKFPVPLSV